MFFFIFSFQLPFCMIYKHNNKKQSVWKCITMEFDVIRVMNHDKIVFHFIIFSSFHCFSILEIMENFNNLKLDDYSTEYLEGGGDQLPRNDHVLTFKISLHFSTEISNLQDLLQLLNYEERTINKKKQYK